METLVFTGIVNAGKGFLAHMIYDSYDLLKDTATQQHPHLQNVLLELDLKADLQVIEALLMQIKDEEFKGLDQQHIHLKKSSEKDGKKELKTPISICLKNVSEMVGLIKNELENIKEEIKDHEQKWLANWRTPPYEPHLRKLAKHKKILDKRMELLIKILQLE